MTVTFAGDDVDKKKPDPKIYNVAVQRLGVDPADCVVIEYITVVT
jgi:HAD superfamily hydrolase (TIGR01509 family)